MRIVYQIYQIGICTEAWVDFIEIGDVVSAVFKFAAKDRTDPDDIESQLFYVAQTRTDTFQVAVSVSVAIHVRRGVDVIYGRVFQPSGIVSGGKETACKSYEGKKENDSFHLIVFDGFYDLPIENRRFYGCLLKTEMVLPYLYNGVVMIYNVHLL